MSFWKQDPPKPTLACKNFGPMRGSVPQALLISEMSAPVASQRAEMELTEDTRWANMAFATNFESSDDHKFVVRIFSRGTQFAYTPTTVSRAFKPSGVYMPPSNTRDGVSKSGTAVPSARNSGFDRT